MDKNVSRIVDQLKAHGIEGPDVAVILGSGLGDFADHIQGKISISYDSLEGMPEVTVAGHAGSVYYGEVEGKRVIAFGGRFHGYEGHPLETSLILVHIAHLMKVPFVIISNAAGAVTQRLNTGDLVLINDFMSPSYRFALPGKRTRVRFDNKNERAEILKLAASAGIPLQHGTYFFLKGPTYETKAEVRAYRTMGADVVGMSTAPEMLECERLGIRCIGISLVTNMATGVEAGKLDHSEVKETAEKRKAEFAKLVRLLIAKRA